MGSGGRTFGYVPALDGLRALAVCAVLLFHADLGLVDGGFLGVSVFFTLSGFLITSLLLAEHEATGAISLGAFFARRVRRLVPAAYACIVLVLALGAAWGAVQRSNLPGDVVASVLNVANWRFASASTSYQDLFIGGPSPLAHFWSLAIEEQCYILLPLLSWWAMRRGRRVFAGALVALLLASVAATLLTSDTDMVYYGTHTRAAELLAGAVLALVLQHRTIADRWRELAGWLGLAALATAMVATQITDGWLYRGGLAAVAIPSVAVIVGLTGRTTLASIVGWAPLVAIGKVSYGLYLFHWPIFLALTPQRVGMDGWALLGLRLAATTAITVVSYRLLEQPIRQRRALVSPRVARLSLGTAAVALLTIGVAVVPSPRFTPTEQLLAAGEQAVIEFPQPDAVGGEPLAPVVVTPPTRPARVLVLGTDATPVAALRFAGWDVFDGVQRGCKVAAVVDGADPASPSSKCEPAKARWVRMVMAVEPDVVLVSLGQIDALAPPPGDGSGATSDDDLVEQARVMSASALELERSLRLVLAMDVPVVLFDAVPRAAAFDTGLDDLVLSIGVPTTVHRTVDAALAAVSEQLDRDHQSAAPEAIKVLVIGDSTSLGVAQALSEGSGGRLQITWAGANGCPFVRAEAIRPGAGYPWRQLNCEPFDSKLPPLLASWDADVVLLVVGPMELLEQRYPGDSDGRVAGDDEFTAFHDSEMAALVGVLRLAGVPLLVTDSPPLSTGPWSSREMVAPQRLEAWNAQVARWVDTWPEVSLLPYAQIVSDYEAEHGTIRADGVHPNVVVLTDLARQSLVELVLAAVSQSPEGS